MNFIFTCPNNGQVFETDAFSIIENRGVAQDPDGNRYLDAQVRLDGVCPYCGEMHTYRASELSCPFGSNS